MASDEQQRRQQHVRENSDVDDEDRLDAQHLLRADSPLVIEDDEDLSSFLQRESSLDPLATDFQPSRHAYRHDPRDLLTTSPTATKLSTRPAPRLTPFIVLLTAAACISGFLFGYDTGVISATLVSIGPALTAPDPLSTLDKSLITSCTSLLALVASPPGGMLADRWGRKAVIVLADVLFVGGAVLQALAASVPVMIAGRSLVGAAVGAASLVVPLYISELAPPEFRGRLVVLNVLFITGGQMVAYLTGWWLAAAFPVSGWRYMVGLGAAPATLQLLLLVFLPETPRWLVRAGRHEQARVILNRVYGKKAENTVDAIIRAIEREVLEEEEQAASLRQARGSSTASQKRSIFAFRPDGWDELFSVGGHRRALAIACLLQGMQQLCGFNSVMYFSATIFAAAGFQSPILASLVVANTNFVFTVVAMLFIDRIGRRRILLWTVPVMIIGLLMTAAAFSALPPSAVIFSDIDDTSSTLPADESRQSVLTTILLALGLYVAAYAAGIGNVPWQQAELFPLAVRSLGCGLATATCWAANFAVGLTFLPLMRLLGPGWTFTGYAVLCAAGWLLIRAIYPETRGLGLEEVGGLLKHGWGVEESLRRASAG